jgi:tetratricopeptide (TPR) repeat protein
MSYFRKARGGLAALLLAAVPGTVHADVIVLKNGNEIRGEIVEENSRRLTVKFTGGTIYLELRDVASVRREGKLQYLLSEGETMLRRSPEDAVAIFEKALEREPTSEPARKGLLAAQEKHGEELASAHRYREAIAAYQSLLVRAPDHPRAAGAVARIEETLQRLAEEERSGMEALRRGKLDEALPHLKRVYQELPERRAAVGTSLARALILKGNWLLSNDRIEEAESSYIEAVSIDPDLVPDMSLQFGVARARRLWPLAERSDWKGLLSGAEDGLRVAPESPLLAYLGALALQGMGRTREAAEEYLKITGGERPPDLARSVERLRQEAEARIQVALRGEAAPRPDPRRDEVLPGDLREIETEHFVVRHRNVTIAAEVADSAEESYRNLYRELDCRSHWFKRCTITIFPTKEEFQDASGQQAWTGGSHQILRRLGGLADHRIFSYQNQPRLAGAVIPHEVGHAMLAFRVGYAREIPLWLNEGFAIQREPSYVHRYYSRIVSDAAQNRTLIPLSKLLGLAAYPSRDEEVKLFYAESYSLVDLLLEERKLATLIDFISELSAAPGALERLLQKHYRLGNLKGLESRWLGRL